MRKSLWIVIISVAVIGALIFLSGVLAASGVPLPVVSPAAAQAECDCSHLKKLRIELRNALRLQQAFRGKISELRAENVSTSKNMLQIFAKGDARKGLETIPDYKGPSEFDYVSYGDTQDPDQSHRYTKETLCAVDKAASQLLEAAKQASACTGIGAALQAHEDWHVKFCLATGYLPYLRMHGSDRAQEEVEAYEAQIKVLREIIVRLRCGYRATGQDGPVVYSGVICSLEEPFTVTGTHPLFTFPFKFVPSSPTAGMMTYGTSGSGISAAGGGPYTIEGADTDTPRILVNSQSTASSRAATTSGGGMATIKLVPLETSGECPARQPR